MNKHSEDGISLVSTLVLLALLSSIVVTFIYLNRVTILETSNRVQLAHARASADGGLELASFVIRASLITPETPDGGTRICYLKDAIVYIKVEDEAGKIDLNGASEDLLFDFASLFEETDEDAQRVVDRILDYRDADDDPRPLGAETREYQDLGLAFPPKNRPFQIVDELYQVAGLSNDFIAKAAPHLTVYSRRSGIAPEFATIPVLLAATGSDLRFTDELLNEIDPSEWARLRSRVPTGRAVRSPGQSYSIIAHVLQDSGFAYSELNIVSITGQERAITLLERRRLSSSSVRMAQLIDARKSSPSCTDMF